jgi:hypothetical protein
MVGSLPAAGNSAVHEEGVKAALTSEKPAGNLV